MLVGLFSYIVTGSSVITYPLKIIFLIVIAGHPEKHRDSRTGRHFRGGPSGKTQEFPDRKTFQRGAVRKNTGIPGQEDISEGAIRKNTGIPGQEDISGLRCLYKQNTRVIPDKEQCD